MAPLHFESIELPTNERALSEAQLPLPHLPVPERTITARETTDLAGWSQTHTRERNTRRFPRKWVWVGRRPGVQCYQVRNDGKLATTRLPVYRFLRHHSCYQVFSSET
jgi:hypothetical protein